MNCVICESSTFNLIQKAEEPYKVLKCRTCGLVVVTPFPKDSTLSGAYSYDYYKEWVSTQKVKRDKLWFKRFKYVSSLCGKKGRILDVGCGDGSFLEVAKDGGFDVYGTEFSPYAAKFVSEKLNIHIHNQDVTTVGFEDSYFDVISAWHVLEHVKNPLEVLVEFKRILKKDGHLIIAVPNYNNLVMQFAYKMFKGKTFPLFSIHAKEQHLFYYTAETLAMILKKCGFTVKTIETDISAIEPSKRLVDNIALIFYYIFNIKIFGAIRVTAILSD